MSPILPLALPPSSSALPSAFNESSSVRSPAASFALPLASSNLPSADPMCAPLLGLLGLLRPSLRPRFDTTGAVGPLRCSLPRRPGAETPCTSRPSGAVAGRGRAARGRKVRRRDGPRAPRADRAAEQTDERVGGGGLTSLANASRTAGKGNGG